MQLDTALRKIDGKQNLVGNYDALYSQEICSYTHTTPNQLDLPRHSLKSVHPESARSKTGAPGLPVATFPSLGTADL